MSFEDVKNYTINRKWNGETSLVIGCGNGPGCSCEKYKQKHMHHDAYTVDIDPIMNPCLVADVIHGGLYGIPSNSMDRIELEGLCVKYRDRKNIVDEINRVKKPMCHIDVAFFSVGSYRDRHTGRWANYYGDKVFIQFNELDKYQPVSNFDVHIDKNGYPVLYCNDTYGTNKQIKLTDGYSGRFVPTLM